MKMYKAISLLDLFGVVGNAYSVQMTPQIQSLLDQKAQKVAELEKCDKTRKGFMIAGISTLGLTAVGVGGNIALANKNKKLDAELDSKKTELAGKQNKLISLQNQRLQEQLAQKQTGLNDGAVEASKEQERVVATTEAVVPTQLDASIDGTGYCYKDIDKEDEYDDDCLNFHSMRAGDWGVVFPYGEVYGKAVCNDTEDSYGVASNDERYETGGVNCWCKMTHPAVVSRWVFNDWYLSASACAKLCAFDCARNVRNAAEFRGAVFGATAQ